MNLIARLDHRQCRPKRERTKMKKKKCQSSSSASIGKGYQNRCHMNEIETEKRENRSQK